MLIFVFLIASLASKAQSDYGAYVAALDTLIDADTATHVMAISGSKKAISIQVNVLKISGTVAGTLNLYGSVDGTNYITAPIASAITVTNASANYAFTLTNNNYRKLKLA